MIDNVLQIDLEKWRTPKELLDYFGEIRELINTNAEYKEMACLKKGVFKKVSEEFWPLCCFGQSKYCEENTMLRLVLGNQGFDAIMKEYNGQEKRLEFTQFIDGRTERTLAEKMLKGEMPFRFNDSKCLEERSFNYINDVMINAFHKSVKDYCGVDLIICVNTFDYFEVYNNSSKDFIELLITKLRELSFSADRVFLVVFNSGIDQIDKNIHAVK